MGTSHSNPTTPEASSDEGGSSRLLFDIAHLDLGAVYATKSKVEELIPHRGCMSLVDAVIWRSDDFMQVVGRMDVRDDAFWCEGHFPGKPTLPGVLMIEAAAQLSCWAFLAHLGQPSLVLFLRIQEASFRQAVFPGETLYLLSQGVKRQKRRFMCNVMGLISGKERIAFQAVVSGMTVDRGAY